MIARGVDGLDAAADEIRWAGGEALVLPADVSDARQVQKAAHALFDRFGRIDTWVNDAMVSVFSPVVEMTPEEYRRVTEVNYLGTVYGTLAALRYMLPADDGVILQIGSALVYRSIPLQSAYCATKAAIRGFTDSLRCELIHDRSRVRVCMLQLPAVNTPQFDVVRTRLPRHPQPVPPIFQPEMIARAALHLTQHPRREMWVGWPTAKAILAQKFIGGLLDRYLARFGWDSQMDERPIDPETWRDNLHEPLPGDRGAHGDFDDRSRGGSVELWARMNAGKIAAVAGAAAAAVIARRFL
ncbi:MAG: SDR family oxidoreductase [Myxococcales bacterium]|nr:SDR family oxidoreductase [Myxococcales bacterium]